jgi:hypothetical protein
MLGTRRLARFVGATLPLLLVAALAAPARAGGLEESSLLTLTNTVRVAAGAPGLSADGTLSSIARNWASTMASQGGISHNPNLKAQIEAAGIDWRKTGENVGFGPTLQSVHDALVASSGHYRNIVDASFDRIGIGVVVSGGSVWVVQVFLTTAGPPPPAPAPQPEPAPAPAPRRTFVPDPTPPPAPAPEPAPVPVPVTEPPPLQATTTTTTTAPTTTTTVAPTTTTTVVLPPPSAGLPLQLALMVEQLKALGAARR